MTKDSHLVPLASHCSSRATVPILWGPSRWQDCETPPPFYLFIYIFCRFAKKKYKKSTASCENGPGGTFDFTVHYARSTASHFKWMCRPHGPVGLNFKFATCEDTRRAWQKADRRDSHQSILKQSVQTSQSVQTNRPFGGRG